MTGECLMTIGFKRAQGFNLVQLMIGLAVVGILLAIGYPTYDAKIALVELAQLHENYFAKNNGRYASTFDQLGFSASSHYLGYTLLDNSTLISKDGHYVLTFTAAGTNTFLLTARADPNGVQTSDEQCQNFSINHQGLRTSQPNSSDCW